MILICTLSFFAGKLLLLKGIFARPAFLYLLQMNCDIYRFDVLNRVPTVSWDFFFQLMTCTTHQLLNNPNVHQGPSTYTLHTYGCFGASQNHLPPCVRTCPYVIYKWSQTYYIYWPNYFKKECFSSSFLLTQDNNTGPNWPGVLSRLVPCI